MVCVCMCGRREQRLAGRGKLRKARMKLSNMVLGGGEGTKVNSLRNSAF